jgi:RimJ/RimL family protein N-acetyltransferase
VNTVTRPTTIDLAPVTLEGRRVRMEPLDLAWHWEGLLAIGLDPELWRWTLTTVESPEDLRRYLESALADHAAGRALPFATRDVVSGRIAGCTRFGTIDPGNRRVEIGWTLVGRPFQRTHVNTEAKYLMLGHAFERWECRRVELKTHVLNEPSRNAILRIGATFEGVLRSYQTSERGVTRDTAMFSIVDREWPDVKARLERLMEADSSAPPRVP